MPNPKKKRKCHTNPISPGIGTIPEDDLAEVLLSEQMWETTSGSHWIHFRKTGVYSILVVGWNLIRRKALKNAALRNVTFQKGWRLTRHDESRWSAQHFKEIAHRYYCLPRLPMCMTPFWPLVYVGKPSLATGLYFSRIGSSWGCRKTRYPKIHWFIFQIKIATATTWGKSW